MMRTSRAGNAGLGADIMLAAGIAGFEAGTGRAGTGVSGADMVLASLESKAGFRAGARLAESAGTWV